MATTKLGTKYLCYQCGTKFYDLGRPEPLCPNCKSNQKNAPPLTEAGKAAARDARRAPEEVEEAEAPDLELGIDDEELEGLDEEPGADDEEEADLDVEE